jgi:hypothetical protein
MSWSEAARNAKPSRPAKGLSGFARALAVAGMVVSATALGACSFQPVYSGTLASQPMLNLAFAKPTSRLQQVVYQELALRFGSSDAATAPLVTVSVTSSAGAVGLSVTSNPNKLYRSVVTATLTIARRDGSNVAPMTFTRQASAEYTTSGQVLADTAAANEAAERAAKAAAESLRLAMLASLSR